MLFFPGGWSPRPGQTLVRAGFRSLSPWQHSSPASLRGEPHGQRSLEDHSPRGHTESDATEHLSTLAADHPAQYTDSSVQEPYVTGHGGISVQTDRTKDPEAG